MPNREPRPGSCKQARRLLSIRREWTPREQAQGNHHLASCPACQALALEYELMDRRLGRLPEPVTAAVGLFPGQRQKLIHERARRTQPVSGLGQVAQGVALLAVVAAFIALALVWSGGESRSPVGLNFAGPESGPLSTPSASPPPEGVVTEIFAWPAPGILTQRYSEHHHAVDIANQLGTPVLAIAGGTVIQTEEEHELHGTYVLLDHGDGYRSFYSHLSLTHVQVGERVVQGQKIGLMGRTGLATGPHLHFEIRREGRQIDPLAEIPKEVWEKQLAPALEPGDNGSEMEGYVWPLQGDLNQGYSISHPALDISQHEGTPVRAMAAGRVTLAAEDAQNGIHVLLAHRDGLTSFYSHLSLAHVEGGEWVTKGQEIGLVGDTGVSTGPHLHLQVRRHGEPINPLDLLPLPHWGE